MYMPDSEDIAAFWDRQPCGIKHSDAPVGSEAWSRQLSARRYFVQPHIRGFAQFSRWRNKRVLEIGCGIGTDSLEFARSGALLVGIDISMKSASIAAERLRAFDHVEIIAANAEMWFPTPGGHGYAFLFCF